MHNLQGINKTEPYLRPIVVVTVGAIAALTGKKLGDVCRTAVAQRRRWRSLNIG